MHEEQNIEPKGAGVNVKATNVIDKSDRSVVFGNRYYGATPTSAAESAR